MDHQGTIEKVKLPYDPYPTYALFPFNSDKSPRLSSGIEFTIAVTVPESRLDEAATAIRALVAFGGVGARTRRGCGTLAFKEGSASLALADVAALAASVGATALVGDQSMGDPIGAWRAAVEVYQEFRQKPGFARNEGQDGRRPGRSRYPEPDTLRRIFHGRAHTPEHPVDGFPRADLGLPIIFHFVNEGIKDVTLQGSAPGRRRFASPVTTKAVAVDGAYRPLVMIRRSPHVWEGNQVEIAQGRVLARSEIELSAAEREKVRPLAGRPIRQALEAYVLTRGFTRLVTR